VKTIQAGVLALALSGILLGGCDRASVERPAAHAPVLGMYRNLAESDARVDADTAAEMISAYRRKHGLKPLILDATLMRIADGEAVSMAASAQPASADSVKMKVAAAGFRAPVANLSAGYQTFAEAFSGWRESKGHDAVMLDPRADRMGIATAYAPGTKYRVFWAMIVADGAPR
jgi:uncharacterized protein YkwD